MKKKVSTIKYSMTVNVPEAEIRWIVCQHCKKPVYGVKVLKDNICPSEHTSTYTSGSVAKWTYEPKRKK